MRVCGEGEGAARVKRAVAPNRQRALNEQTCANVRRNPMLAESAAAIGELAACPPEPYLWPLSSKRNVMDHFLPYVPSSGSLLLADVASPTRRGRDGARERSAVGHASTRRFAPVAFLTLGIGASAVPLEESAEAGGQGSAER